MTHLHDHDRPRRLGMPEAVLCDGKLDQHLVEIIDDLAAAGSPTLLTRLSAPRVAALGLARVPGFVHDPVSSTAVLHGGCEPRAGRVAVVAAGTSDEAVAAEAVATLRFTGVRCDLIVDVGVAGLWRLLDRVDEIREADIVIVVAGMDAALASVMGGLVSAPVVGVPTSVGYGVAEGGITALHAMLASCAQGVTVVNIDNGFGGACAAIRMLSVDLGATAAVAEAADAEVER
ncbi:MAG: NCAIR mutase (PurE)-related protein [Nitriliruptoraceae bacterium]|jgi:NCAIR mutase (PurE)-related protein